MTVRAAAHLHHRIGGSVEDRARQPQPLGQGREQEGCQHRHDGRTGDLCDLPGEWGRGDRARDDLLHPGGLKRRGEGCEADVVDQHRVPVAAQPDDVLDIGGANVAQDLRAYAAKAASLLDVELG